MIYDSNDFKKRLGQIRQGTQQPSTQSQSQQQKNQVTVGHVDTSDFASRLNQLKTPQQSQQKNQNIFQKVGQVASNVFNKAKQLVTGAEKPAENIFQDMNKLMLPNITQAKSSYDQAMKDLSGGSVAYAPKDNKDFQNLQKRVQQSYKTDPVRRLGNDAVNILLSTMQGATGGIIKNPSGNFNTDDLIIKPLGEIAGSTYALEKIGGVVDKMIGSTSLATFLKGTKLKFMLPVLKNVATFDIYGQLDPDVKDRLKQLGTDSAQGTLFGMLEGISKARFSVPLQFAAGVGIAKMNNADNKTALINGVIFAALDGAGKLSTSQAEGDFLPRSTTSIGGTERPSSDVAETVPSRTDTTTRFPSNVYAPGTSTEAVLSDKGFVDTYNNTIKEKDYLQGVINKSSDGRDSKMSVKKKETAAEKVVRKQAIQPGYTPTDLADIIRGNITAKNTEDAQKVLDNIKKNSDVIQVEDYTQDPNTWGYQGMNINIKTPDGNLAEIQVHTPETRAIQKALHPLYEQWRSEKEVPMEIFDQAKKLADEAVKTVKSSTKQVGQNISDNSIIKNYEARIKELTGEKTKPLETTGAGETKISTLASKVQSKAVENKLTDSFGKLPEYKQVSMKEQATLSSDFLSKYPDTAKKIALGEQDAPKGILPESIFVAVEQNAIKNKDVELLRQLATDSKLSTQATAMGQRIRALGERDPESPVGIIQKVSEERKAAVVKKLKGKSIEKATTEEAGKIKEQIKKSAPKKDDWAEFINSIEC